MKRIKEVNGKYYIDEKGGLALAAFTIAVGVMGAVLILSFISSYARLTITNKHLEIENNRLKTQNRLLELRVKEME